MGSPPNNPRQIFIEDSKQGYQPNTSPDPEAGVPPSAVPIDAFKTSDVHPEPNKYICDRKSPILAAIIIILAIARIVVQLTNQYRLMNIPNSQALTSIEPDDIFSGLDLVERSDWLAEPPNGTPVKLALPAHQVVIAHTTTAACDTKDSCATLVKSMQNSHKYIFHFDDIAYNFLIGGDGHVYEGRGWNFTGAHTKGYNSDSIGIAFIGNFMKELPPEEQLNAAKSLITEGVTLNKLAKDYRLYGVRQLTSTDSPGDALYEKIKTCPNWSRIKGSMVNGPSISLV